MRAFLLAGCVLLFGVAGCGQEPVAPNQNDVDTDRDRAAVLSADPVLMGAATPPAVHPGRVLDDKLGWDRTEVTGRLYEANRPTKPAVVEQQLAAKVALLRSGGWTIHWAMCLPPPDEPMLGASPSPPVTIPGEVTRSTGYQWLVFGYKITGGVSYWSMLVAKITDGGLDASVDVILRAPESRDPANLLTAAPKALDPAATCAEDGKDATTVEQAGTPIVVRDWYPFPAQSHSPNPNRL
jgi:hypothetical protein